jgi:hypothetical protein
MLKDYTTTFPDGTMLHWNPLKWGDYKHIKIQFADLAGPAIWLLYDAVAGLCLVDIYSPCESILTDEDLDAGTIATIGEYIISQTGFEEDVSLVKGHLSAARQRIKGSYYATGVAVICAAFGYKPEEIDKFDIEKFTDHLVMAEAAVGADIEPVNKDSAEAKQPPMVPVVGPDGKKVMVPLNTIQEPKQ